MSCFAKNPLNPLQDEVKCPLIIITKLDNENHTGRFGEDMQSFPFCYLVQSSEGTFKTWWQRTAWCCESKACFKTQRKQNYYPLQCARAPWNRKLKLQTFKLRKQVDFLNGDLVPASKIKEMVNLRRSEVFELFREHMIEQLYLELAEETNDRKIYGKLLQACQRAASKLFKD